MVLYVNCEGSVHSAAKAIVAAAAHGDRDAFSAGFAVGASSLAATPEQVADTLTESFSIAQSTNKTLGVALALADAVGNMQGSELTDMLSKVVMAINSLATKAQCSVAGKMATDFFFALIKLNGLASRQFLSISKSTATACWARRLVRVATSDLVKVPLAVSPCTRAMQEASSVSVSLITASTCGNTPAQVASTAYAMVSAAVNNGCAFASAITSASVWGVPCDSLVNIFTLAITKAKVAKQQVDMASAFASAYGEVVYNDDPDGPGPTAASQDGEEFLKSVLTATAKTIDVSGCAVTTPFVKSLFKNLVAVAPANKASITDCFNRIPQIRKCKCI